MYTRAYTGRSLAGPQPLDHEVKWGPDEDFPHPEAVAILGLAFGYFCGQSSFPAAQPALALYLKSTGYSVYQVNVWPARQSAPAVVIQISAGVLPDSPLLNGMRWQARAFIQAGSFFGAVIAAVWTVPKGLLYVVYYMSYMSAGV